MENEKNSLRIIVHISRSALNVCLKFIAQLTVHIWVA